MTPGSFVQNMQLVVDKFQLTSDEIVEACLWAMRGGYRERILNRPDFQLISSWEELRELIRKEFGKTPSLTMVANQLHTIVRKKGESIPDFISRFRTILAPLIGTSLLENIYPIIYQDFIHALADERLSLCLASANPPDVQSLLQKTEELDCLLPRAPSSMPFDYPRKTNFVDNVARDNKTEGKGNFPDRKKKSFI